MIGLRRLPLRPILSGRVACVKKDASSGLHYLEGMPSRRWSFYEKMVYAAVMNIIGWAYPVYFSFRYHHLRQECQE